MRYEVIVEKFERMEEPRLSINKFEANSDAQAVLKIAAVHGCPPIFEGTVEGLEVNDAVELLEDSMACDSVDIVHRIRNLDTGEIIYDQTESGNTSADYDDEYEDYINKLQ